ncbi:hypothetical protein COCNU_02G013780 [Cocos nucifera]|uniref:CDP-diacylglycerol-glycerol-3-phosphate 3-phosphatidyltransferase n=1 Tax=Cocos nucifera TaxID=13894 RepID=A0A8K0HZL2_COCNU|nr:hypothetical protein COCNU_02G013780 [Cocos nucifera]
MERSGSFGTSWADQWDYGDFEPAQEKKKSSGVKNGVEKTKAVASTGLKKVKEGTSLGFQWIKDKYQKRTQKH